MPNSIFRTSDRIAFFSGAICGVLSIPVYVLLGAKMQSLATAFCAVIFAIFFNATFGIENLKDVLLNWSALSRDRKSEEIVGGTMRRFWIFAGGMIPVWLVLVILSAWAGILD